MSASAPSPYAPPSAPLLAVDSTGPLYAGFWRRWAAAFIDGIIAYLLAIVIMIPLALGAPLLVLPGYLVAYWLYYALFHSSSRQATPGKMAFGIKVATADGERVSFLRATGRYFGLWISYLIAGIGYLMAAFTQRKQALHDMISSTVVVRADASPEAIRTGGGTMKVTAGVLICALVLGLVPVIGILAAIAIPAYSDYAQRSRLYEVVAAGTAAKSEVDAFVAKNGRLPATLEEAGVAQPTSPDVGTLRGTFTGGMAVIRVQPTVPQLRDGAVVFSAPAGPAPLAWKCSGDNIQNRYLPPACRS